MNDYPIFKNGIAYIDHTVTVTDEMAVNWIHFEGIKKIVTLTHGTDHIHTTILPIENSPGINTDSTAQWCIYKMLEWAYQQESPIEITEKEILTIGSLGKIGKRIRNWLNWSNGEWGIDIATYSCKGEMNASIKSALKVTDIIFLTINPEGNNEFWNKEKLGWMKPTAILISPSRPSVFSSEALKDKRVIWDKKHIAWRSDAVLQRKREAVQ